MKRPTRVPASTVVRMNRASNMIAKWYQKDLRLAAVAPAKISDMPMASVGAPPVRATSVSSSTLEAARLGARRHHAALDAHAHVQLHLPERDLRADERVLALTVEQHVGAEAAPIPVTDHPGRHHRPRRRCWPSSMPV